MSKDICFMYDYNKVLGLFEKKELKQELSEIDILQVNKYALRLSYLESYGSAHDKESVKEIAIFVISTIAILLYQEKLI
jgi:hypothetical protein